MRVIQPAFAAFIPFKTICHACAPLRPSLQRSERNIPGPLKADMGGLMRERRVRKRERDADHNGDADISGDNHKGSAVGWMMFERLMGVTRWRGLCDIGHWRLL